MPIPREWTDYWKAVAYEASKGFTSDAELIERARRTALIWQLEREFNAPLRRFIRWLRRLRLR